MKLGIVGLPNVGKTTLFNALTNARAVSANYAYSTVEPNVGAVPVPDARLDALAAMFEPKKVTHATVEFVDIAGLARGASRGEGLGNRFLSHIRECDALVQVVRCFDDESVEGSVDPLRDIETIQLELIFADLEMLERRIERVTKSAKGDKGLAGEIALLERLKEHLSNEQPALTLTTTPEEADLLKPVSLLTGKKTLYVANMSEDGFQNIDSNPYFAAVRDFATAHSALALPVCARLEEEIQALEPDERGVFLSELGLEKSGLERLIQQSYRLLGYISFLTAGKPEVRAWTIVEGSKAPRAAAAIHTDFEKGFIRAEVVAFDDLMTLGGMTQAKAKGVLRSEGKEYIMRDGDVVHFLFNL